MEHQQRGEENRKGLSLIQKSDGTNYSVRHDRRRYFFPDEWTKFIDLINNPTHKFFFEVSVFTGGRIMEVLNLKHENIDKERSTVKFEIVKQRKAKKNYKATGKSREFFVSANFIKAYKSFVRGKTPKPDEFLFLDNKKLPEGYNLLDNQARKKYYQSKVVSYSSMLKRYVKKAGIEDYWNFSPHNLRKTYGMWMRTLISDTGELTYRMGHDYDTYLAHYGSSLIFTDAEKRKIQNIMGEVK